ncbi:pVII L2 core protein precursor [Mastadenovirus porcusquartum]|uniref:PVII L2 core protein n=1 Tax=Mastadenovirus porcusquartum TaxID=3241439 RepID=A0A7H0S574_9ADEN|nr:pVII L2 core protein precursor [Porcine mastadenovirus B]QNQ79248.1 pVII L2 core protein precursor [Porcine mastadenovirus B]
MSMLMSPANNTGWGLLGSSMLYGGARKRSAERPVKVRAHYRAPWGTHTGRVRAATAVAQAVAEEIGAPEAVRRRLRKKKRRLRRGLASATQAFLRRAIRRRRQRARVVSGSTVSDSGEAGPSTPAAVPVVVPVPVAPAGPAVARRGRSRRRTTPSVPLRRSSRVRNIYTTQSNGNRVATFLRAHPSIADAVRPHPTLAPPAPPPPAPPLPPPPASS